MRLLVFEYITGGGFANSPLPASLLQEGSLMRNALLNDLRVIKGLELIVLQDQRVSIADSVEAAHIQFVLISQGDDLQSIIISSQADYDSVWLIAPETDGILAQWCHFFSAQEKFLYTSAQQAVTLCQDKLATIDTLQKVGVACVPSHLYDFSEGYLAGSWVIKVNDSVGCDQVYLVQTAADWHQILPRLTRDKHYIMQPYIAGKSLSLSALFYQGKAYLICCNQQHTRLDQLQFVLTSCTVNMRTNNTEKYQSLCQSIAAAIPQLFGYVGIDFIETGSGENLVLEVNPRLTTSYTGIMQALGVNIAELVLNLPNHLPQINASRNQQVFIVIE